MIVSNTSLYEFLQQLPNEEAAKRFFERNRWAGRRECPHCGSERISECQGSTPMPYRCKTCRRHFSVRTGTVLAESKVPLHKWLMAIYLMTTSRKGIPSTQLARQLGVTQKTSWFLAHRIRQAWFDNDRDKMDGQVQIDESYFGGKETNRHENKKRRLGRGHIGKIPVVGVVSETGIIQAHPVQNVSKKTMHAFIEANVKPGATVVTDDLAAYKGLKAHKHIAINHTAGEYVKDQAHTNGIESFWALLKRGYYGVYHWMSPQHIHRYVDEFAYRQSTVKMSAMEFIACTGRQFVGKRLTYRDLVHG